MDTLAQFHLAAQYLAMAGKSFLEPKDDDSHTNVGFFTKDHTLRTWSLDDKGAYLAFSFDDFSLQWCTTKDKILFPLENKTHDDILDWISRMATVSNFEKPYNYNLHYELPYNLSNGFTFKLSSTKELNRLLQLRILAQETLETFLKRENLESEIRIWPHHLDTGAFVVLNDESGKSMGLGMAIPDSVSDSHYFYISGYKGHDAIETGSYSKLTHGQWKNENFIGAILNAAETTSQQAIQFFHEAYNILIK